MIRKAWGWGKGTAVVLVQRTVGAQLLAFAPTCCPLSQCIWVGGGLCDQQNTVEVMIYHFF